MDFTAAIIFITLFSLAGFFFGCAVGQISEKRHWHQKQNGPVQYERTGAHEHRYTYMLGDGKGWRCHDCGEPKPREKR